MAMPVVDARNRLLGIVTVDDVVDVLQEEATEDVQKMFGAGAEERLTSRWQFSFRMRVWWLVVNLATAFLAGAVVGAFQPTLQKLTLLAIYMPIVAGMGGNAGAQAMAVSIRGIARGEVDRSLIKKILWREFLVGAFSGIVIGLLLAGSESATQQRRSGFPVGMREFGYVLGQDYIIEDRYADGDLARLPRLVQELVRLKPDVVVTGTTVGTIEVKRATRTIPIVGVSLTDPVGFGLAASLVHPGDQVTGILITSDGFAPRCGRFNPWPFPVESLSPRPQPRRFYPPPRSAALIS